MAAPRFIFVTGNDEFLVQRKARSLFEQAAEGLDEWSRDILDARAGKVEEVETAVARFAEAVQTLSMFGERKAVWLKDISFLNDSVTGRAEGTKVQGERLQEILEGVDPASVAVVLSASPVDRRRREVKWLETHGETFLEQVGGKGGEDLSSLAVAEARALGVELSPDAAELLVALTGRNARILLAECGKLASYSPGGRLTAAEVLALVPPLPESEFFAAAEALSGTDLDAALRELRQHFFSGHDARPVLAQLLNRNRLMLQLAVLRESGALRGRVNKASLEQAYRAYAALFPEGKKHSLNVFSQNPFYLSRLAGASERLTVADCLERQRRYVDAFRAINGVRANEQEAVLRNLAIALMGQPRRASA